MKKKKEEFIKNGRLPSTDITLNCKAMRNATAVLALLSDDKKCRKAARIIAKQFDILLLVNHTYEIQASEFVRLLKNHISSMNDNKRKKIYKGLVSFIIETGTMNSARSYIGNLVQWIRSDILLEEFEKKKEETA